MTGGWKTVATNFVLRIEGDGVSHATVDEALGKSFLDFQGAARPWG